MTKPPSRIGVGTRIRRSWCTLTSGENERQGDCPTAPGRFDPRAVGALAALIRCDTYNPTWYTDSVPTALKRSYVTHVPPVEAALEAARALHPDEPPSALLVRLITEGGQSMRSRSEVASRLAAAERERLLARREAQIGRFVGIYGPGYLEEVREGWPE